MILGIDYLNWQFIGLAWLGLGALCVGGIEYAARSSGTKGPLSQESFLGSLGYVLGLLVGAPFIAAFALAQMALIAWRGSIPITGKHWWPARAKKFGATLTEESNEATLCRMIELRRKEDRALRKQPRPAQTPVFQLWRTPEYIIYSIVRNAMLLKVDGLSESEAVTRIDTALRLGVARGGAQGPTVEQYIEQVLGAYSPAYLLHGVDLRDSAIKLAKANVQHLSGFKGGGYPPAEWLTSRMDWEDFDREFANRLDARKLLVPSSRFDIEFAEFIVRQRDNDELWRFSSPAETWRMMMGRGGIALVRDGRSIAHIETVMN